jgi:uncharacterized protein (TIGR02118 family)
MEKAFVFLRRLPDEPVERFRERYLREHARRVLELPGVQRYAANLVEDVPPVLTPEVGFGNPGTGVDAVDEIWFDRVSGLPELYQHGVQVAGAYRIDERIIVSHTPDWPKGERSPWFKRIAFLKRAEHMTHEEFADYWKNVHGPLAAKTHQTVTYVQNLITGLLDENSKPWDGIVQMTYWSMDDFVRKFFPNEEAKAAIMEDVPKFISGWGETRPAWSLGEYIMR